MHGAIAEAGIQLVTNVLAARLDSRLRGNDYNYFRVIPWLKDIFEYQQRVSTRLSR